MQYGSAGWKYKSKGRIRPKLLVYLTIVGLVETLRVLLFFTLRDVGLTWLWHVDLKMKSNYFIMCTKNIILITQILEKAFPFLFILKWIIRWKLKCLYKKFFKT